jgi:hypothetical protein
VKDKGELPGALDFEVAEVGRFGFVELVLDDFVDAAAAGAFFEFGAELVEVFARAGGDDFDIAGVGVADPAAKAELGGFAVDEPAKADALNAAADEKVKNHQSKVSVAL